MRPSDCQRRLEPPGPDAPGLRWHPRSHHSIDRRHADPHELGKLLTIDVGLRRDISPRRRALWSRTRWKARHAHALQAATRRRWAIRVAQRLDRAATNAHARGAIPMTPEN